jgi:protein disulfide-isomerase A1
LLNRQRSHADNHSVVVAYGDASHPIPEVFKKTADVLRDSFLFGSSTDSAAFAKASGSPSLPAIVLYKTFDEGHVVAEDVSSLSTDKLKEFINNNSVPLLDQISPENFGSYAEKGLPIAYLFVDPADSAREALIKTLEPIAKAVKGVVSFVWIDAIKFIDHGKSLNLAGDKWPAFVIQDLAAQTKFPLDPSSAVDAKSVKALVDKFVSGGLKPSVKSAPVPASQDAPVYKLVADGWDQLFGDNTKDVFAEFMAPWCGHCR